MKISRLKHKTNGQTRAWDENGAEITVTKELKARIERVIRKALKTMKGEA